MIGSATSPGIARHAGKLPTSLKASTEDRSPTRRLPTGRLKHVAAPARLSRCARFHQAYTANADKTAWPKDKSHPGAKSTWSYFPSLIFRLGNANDKRMIALRQRCMSASFSHAASAKKSSSMQSVVSSSRLTDFHSPPSIFQSKFDRANSNPIRAHSSFLLSQQGRPACIQGSPLRRAILFRLCPRQSQE